MTSCAIMQPTYLPWAGYFNLMATADVFVYLDDAQFQRRSWHHRNQIALNGAATFLTVPVCSTVTRMKICEARINYTQNWWESHGGQLRQAYGRTESGMTLVRELESAWRARPHRLVDLNLMIIDFLASLLKIETPRILSSELGIGGFRSQRLLSICSHLGADHYLSPIGSAKYLEEDGFTDSGGVSLHLQDFAPEPYNQHGTDAFIPYLSVVDVIANMGSDFAAGYVRQPAFSDYVQES